MFLFLFRRLINDFIMEINNFLAFAFTGHNNPIKQSNLLVFYKLPGTIE